MSTTGMVISGIVVLIGLVWIALPLFQRHRLLPSQAELQQRQHEHLLTHYDRVLRSIRDLEEDYSTGKVTQNVYETSREGWVQMGTQILQALDEMPEIKLEEPKVQNKQDIDDMIEAEIANYLAKAKGQA